MIITRTPFRISFFGGGTDYPAWYKENGGAVLATTIDKYCYISCRKLPPFFEHKHRIVYSKIEKRKQFDLDITLPEDNRDVIYGVVKNCFKEPVDNAVVKLVEVVCEHGKEERRDSQG